MDGDEQTMNRTEWHETWQRLRERWSEWTPTKVEHEDWCLGLLRYSQELVEEVARHVASTFSSKTPRLAWMLRECEKRVREESITRQLDKHPHFHIDADEFNAQKESGIKRLEETPIDELRAAFDRAKVKHGDLLQRPTDSNPRNWKQTVRAAVLCELKGGGQS